VTDASSTSTSERVALVTGANRGIGLEVAKQLAANRFTTLLTARDPNKGTAAAKELALGRSDVHFLQLDVSDPSSIRRCAEEVDRRFGRLDVLVNNAAVLYDTWQRALNADLEVVHEALETNLFGAWRTCQLFVPLMRRNRWGRIVNVSSGAGSIAHMGSGTPAYSISKAALNALTRILAAELWGTGILVNAVCPGWVATDMGGRGGGSVEKGAASVMWAVLLPDDGPTGGFFRHGHPLPW
jgi:NAD(P)-dependent dehydrogenase (short-subunit alcohol dehydrogenase family)